MLQSLSQPDANSKSSSLHVLTLFSVVVCTTAAFVQQLLLSDAVKDMNLAVMTVIITGTTSILLFSDAPSARLMLVIEFDDIRSLAR